MFSYATHPNIKNKNSGLMLTSEKTKCFVLGCVGVRHVLDAVCSLTGIKALNSTKMNNFGGVKI